MSTQGAFTCRTCKTVQLHWCNGECRKCYDQTLAYTVAPSMRMVVQNRAGEAVALMLDEFHNALDADMESGAPWMTEANWEEFRKKYPRFCLLLKYARNIKWEDLA